MEPDGIAETMLEEVVMGAPRRVAAALGWDLMPSETMFQKGKSSKLFNL